MPDQTPPPEDTTAPAPAGVLFNTQTLEPDPINDPEVLHQALLTGSHSFAAGTQVNALDPTGSPVNLPAEETVKAIQAGYQILTPTQTAAEQFKAENPGLKGALRVGLESFGNEALLGLPELIYQKT